MIYKISGYTLHKRVGFRCEFSIEVKADSQRQAQDYVMLMFDIRIIDTYVTSIELID